MLYAIVHFVRTIFSEGYAGITEFSFDKLYWTNALLKGYVQVFFDGIVESFTIQTLARYKILDQGRENFLQSQI